MISYYVVVGYGIINCALALAVLFKSRRNLLSKFYTICVFMLAALGVTGGILDHGVDGTTGTLLEHLAILLFALFPFVFVHFMLIFARSYEILQSRGTLFANYLIGLFSYALTVYGFIPRPFTLSGDINAIGFTYFLTWMSILFSVGVALLYSSISGFDERRSKSGRLFAAFALLMLLLPTPFTLSVFSVVSKDSPLLYSLSSTCALTIVVYVIFRHRITANTPYQVMKRSLAAMNDVLVKTDTSFVIEMVQGGFDTLLGYQEDDLLGRPLSFLIPDITPFQTKQTTEGATTQVFDCGMRRKDGQSLAVEMSLTSVVGNDEIIGFVGLARDITARKLAEESLKASIREKEILLREVHHRVKNNLQVISSLLNLQSRAMPDQEACELFQESQRRVKAMAMIHERLCRSHNIASVEFGEYLRMLTTSLFHSYAVNGNIRLFLDSKDILFDIDTAIPCGLIVNELVSNALKHAFPVGRTGSLHVSVHRLDGGAYRLIVEDDGTGFPPDFDLETSDSLGLNLVRLLVRQLQGTVNLDSTQGARFTILLKPHQKTAE